MIPKTIAMLKNGGVGVMPTDTIYGLVGSALSKKAVFRIYKLRRRSPEKPFIILISSLKELGLFKIKLDVFSRKILDKVWPNPVSVVLPCPSKDFFYLHRGKKTLAFRLPKDRTLVRILKETGPLIAPSANLEGMVPAESIGQAKKYFGNKVDFYNGKKTIKGQASTLIEIKNRKINILRQGKTEIKI